MRDPQLPAQQPTLPPPEKPVRRWRIVFLHGLEAGPNGNKAEYLRANFPNQILAPDLELSTWLPTRRNSITRNGFNVRESFRKCVAIAMKAIRDAEEEDARAAAAAKSPQLRFLRSLWTEDDESAPKRLLLVGSSWGGAVALQCLREGLRPDRVLLLAPALAVQGALRWVFEDFIEQLPATLLDGLPPRSVTIVHGTRDRLIPLSASQRFAAAFPAKVELRELDLGHGLGELLFDLPAAAYPQLPRPAAAPDAGLTWTAPAGAGAAAAGLAWTCDGSADLAAAARRAQDTVRAAKEAAMEVVGPEGPVIHTRTDSARDVCWTEDDAKAFLWTEEPIVLETPTLGYGGPSLREFVEAIIADADADPVDEEEKAGIAAGAVPGAYADAAELPQVKSAAAAEARPPSPVSAFLGMLQQTS